jgi:CheY-like chemotaxis protein
MAELSVIEKLLIVDDHAPTRQWLRGALASPTRTITESTDGAEAVTAFAAQQPDWVLMDIDMKPMDGLTATRLIKQSFPNARIIVVTNHATTFIRAEAEKAGAIYFLEKQDLWRLPALVSKGGEGLSRTSLNGV